MSLTFDAAIPSTLLPKVGDKLATVELSDKLPFGFAGLVREVKEDSCGYIVSCDTLQFEEVMYRFYGVNEIVLKQEEPQISYFSKSYSRPFYLPPINFENIHLNLSKFINEVTYCLIGVSSANTPIVRVSSSTAARARIVTGFLFLFFVLSS
jgi:hypothetical protein